MYTGYSHSVIPGQQEHSQVTLTTKVNAQSLTLTKHDVVPSAPGVQLVSQVAGCCSWVKVHTLFHVLEIGFQCELGSDAWLLNISVSCTVRHNLSN